MEKTIDNGALAPQLLASERVYTEGQYAAQHPDWHLTDAPWKAQDIWPGLVAIIDSLPAGQPLRLADVGCGAGGVLAEVLKLIKSQYPEVVVHAIGFEISADAVALARTNFPELEVRQKFLNPSDGPFDAVMFVDVLEHVENPRELIRIARATARHMLIRQPLLGGLSTFRHNNYRDQRQHWGHIEFFDYRLFMDIAESCGFKPLKVTLQAPWELAGVTTPDRVVPLKRLITRWNRIMSSFFIAGFYLNGAFMRLDAPPDTAN